MTFRTRIFASTLAGAAIALAVVTIVSATVERRRLSARIEADLVARTRLAAELLSSRPAPPSLDAEADGLARLTGTRVTFIGPDGRVLGDSDVDEVRLHQIESHADRPEVRTAMSAGTGTASRFSETVGREMHYAAARVQQSPVAIVRLALPAAGVDDQLAVVWRSAVAAAAAGLATALLLSWAVSFWLARRVHAIAAVARRYAEGDLTRPVRAYGNDEIGDVARVLDDSVQELGRRLDDSARDRAHMEAILSGMFEGVVLVNAAGRLLLANNAARTMLQMPADPLGRHYLEIIRQPDIAAMVGIGLRGATSERLELSLGRDPNQIFAARSTPVPGGQGGGAVLVLHDVTALRQADRIRRDFVANVSHELRTPLTAVRGYVEALLDAPPDAEAQRKFLEIIARHTLRMERLVKDLLRLARLDAGQESLERAVVGLATLIAGVETELQTAIEDRRMRVDVAVAPGADAIAGDPAKLHDAFRNLVENAVHYGAEGSSIDIAARREGNVLVVEVGDRGPGIPPGDLQRIFERFYRVDRARTRDPGGTGLGLAIVKHLIGLHGGTVIASNREGGGALFTVRLPQE